MTQFTVIMPAAGRSVRFGRIGSKLLQELGGRPILAHSLDAFLARGDVGAVILPVQDPGTAAQALAAAYEGGELDGRIHFCDGGGSRAESVREGLLASDPAVEWVAVHDAARPLVSQALIDQVLRAARDHGAAAPALPVELTIKQAVGPLPARVQRTIPRNTLWATQTPQIMRRSTLMQAFNNCLLPLEAVTDDAQLMELAGEDVWLVEGEERNIKITTALDLQIAALLMNEH